MPQQKSRFSKMTLEEQIKQMPPEEYNKQFESIMCSFKLIHERLLEPIKVFETIFKPFQELQQKWLSTVFFNYERIKEPKTKIKLINYKNGKVSFEMKTKTVRKIDSLHLLLLRALLFESDNQGFISYQKIEDFFVKHGKIPIENKRASRKRIWDTIFAMFRFLGIASKYRGINLLKKIAGKGLKLYNPEIEK